MLEKGLFEKGDCLPNSICRAHLVQKPVEPVARPMLYLSRAGEYDLFGDSGSALIAAPLSGRKAFLSELDPLFCDVILQC